MCGKGDEPIQTGCQTTDYSTTPQQVVLLVDPVSSTEEYVGLVCCGKKDKQMVQSGLTSKQRDTVTRDSGTVPGIPGHLVTLQYLQLESCNSKVAIYAMCLHLYSVSIRLNKQNAGFLR